MLPSDFRSSSITSPKTTELELGDIDDMESELTDLSLKPAAPVVPKQLKLVKVPFTPMDLKTAMVSCECNIINLKSRVLNKR